MFNPRLGPNGETKQEEPNGNDHHMADNGERKRKKMARYVFFYKDDIFSNLLFCLGEYKFILPPDEEGTVYQCHLCSYSGKLPRASVTSSSTTDIT
jgi:hypothetical protein